MSNRSEGAGQAGARTVSIGGSAVTIEPVSARKASVAFGLLRRVSGRVPELTKAYAAFVETYRQENTRRLSRVQARLEYPARPVIGLDGQLVREPDTIAGPDGEPVANPAAGELILEPSRIDRMTEEDWTASGNVLEVPRDPQPGEVIASLLPQALDYAEEEVYELLTLFTMSNRDVKQARGNGDGIKPELARRKEELLDDAMFDELIELAVVAGETVDEQFKRKAEQLGDRLGNALSLVGLGSSKSATTSSSATSTDPAGPGSPPTSPTSSSTSSATPTSSTDSPAPTPDGPPSTSSTPDGTSSPRSADGSTATPNEPNEPAPNMSEEPRT